MSRKTEQEIVLNEQIRFWTDKQRKARTLKQQLQCASVLKQLRAERWPSPIDEANAVAKATKLKIKADKLVAKAEPVCKPSEWLERPNPVEEQARRAAIRTKMRTDRAAAEEDVSNPIEPDDVVIPDGGDSAAATEAVAASLASTEVTVSPEASDAATALETSPEMERLFRVARESAEHQSASVDAPTRPVVMGLEQISPFAVYQEAVAEEERLRKLYREQHPVRGDVREEGQLRDSFTGRPVIRGE